MNFLKKLIQYFLKKIFGSASFSVYQRIIYLVKLFKGGYFSINGLDKKLEKYVNYDDGFFVELGANDGVSQSNTLYFEIKRNWKGVLVEPSPHNFQKCIQQRSKLNSIFCNACVSFDYQEKYVDIKYADLMTISDNLELDLIDKKTHINAAKEILNKKEDRIFSFGSYARTLNSLLDESNAPNLIDFLSLDVEGAELEVLKGINFHKYKFKFILIEVRNFQRINCFLEQKKYFLEKKFSVHDYLFKYFKT